MDRKKRIADWLEKMSVAFTAGSVLSEKSFLLCIFVGMVFFLISLYLTKK